MIYLIDGQGQHVGPFENRDSVERFIGMMALCGEDWADNKIVEGDCEDSSWQDPAPMGSNANSWKRSFTLKLVGRKS